MFKNETLFLLLLRETRMKFDYKLACRDYIKARRWTFKLGHDIEDFGKWLAENLPAESDVFEVTYIIDKKFPRLTGYLSD